MSIIKFLHLIKRNLAILIFTPILMVLLVLYFTRNPIYLYSSETTLYTGIASGTSVEMDKSLSFFATNTAFDNLINVIKSRDTQQEVAIRLLAQHLMLPKPDPRYISGKSFNHLKSITPKYVEALVMKSPNRLITGKINTQPISQNQNQSGSQPLNYEIDISSNSDSSTFSFSKLDTSSVKISTLPVSIDRDAYEQTVKNLEGYLASNDTNFIYKLLYFNHPHYSVKAISSIGVQRIGTSDLIKIKYEADDPGICQQTLALMTEVCIENYKKTKENRSDAVVKYFEYQLKLATARLQIGEDKLLKFNEDHNIINYYEQSKAVAIVKENLDVSFHEKRIKLAGIDAAIKRIEEKLETQQKIQLNNTTIIEKRTRLGILNSQIAAIEIFGSFDMIKDQTLIDLKIRADKLKDDIFNSANNLYSFSNNTEGLPISNLLNDWLKNVIDYEDTKAGLEVLGDRIMEFQKQYAIYAPAGANIKRIEREINVSEQEFLELLHGLNLAKLKMQDAELSSNIKTIDPPFYPLSPNPTNRKILVLASAILGLLFVLGVILAMEYFDETLRNPERASKILNLKMLGVFPKIIMKTGSLNFLFVSNRLLEIIIQKIDLITKKNMNSTEPRIILFVSSLDNEGKTVLAGNLALKYKLAGKKILLLNYSYESLQQFKTSQIGYNENSDHFPIKNKSNSNKLIITFKKLVKLKNSDIPIHSPFLDSPENYLNQNEYISFQVNSDYFSASNYKDIALKYSKSDDIPDYIFIIIPPILFYSYPPLLISSVDLVILICRANRIWSLADQGALDILKNIISHEPVALLNGVELTVIESVLGDLPKKRTFLRRFVKKMVQFQFFTQDKP